MKKMEFNHNLEENLEMDTLEQQIEKQRKLCRHKKAFVLGMYASFPLAFLFALPVGFELLLIEAAYTVLGGVASYVLERAWSSDNRLKLEQLTYQKDEQERKMATFAKELSTISRLKVSLQNLKKMEMTKQPFDFTNSHVHGIRLYTIPSSTKHSFRILQANVSSYSSSWEDEECFDTLWLEEKDSVDSGIQYILRRNKAKEHPPLENASLVHWDHIATEQTVSKQLKKRKKVSLF